MKVQEQVSKGNFLSLFTSRDRFGRFLHAILIGLPSWFVVGVLITFSPEFAKMMGVVGTVSAGNSVMYCYLGLVAGDLASGILSQLLKSRKKVVLLFLIITVVAVAIYFMAGGVSAEAFYVICGLL
ncbi:MFS transporter, partial [bacterium]|nr:MFS transporter [bacterium]